MSVRGSAWSVTMNMKNIPKERCEEYIAQARQHNWSVEGQIEKGDKEGTEHYQLLVRTPQVRFTAVKKMFPTAHIELARNLSALKQYVHKVETRVEEVRSVENRWISWRDVRDRFFQWVVSEGYDTNEIDEGRLMLFDRFIGLCIEEGLEVDTIGVNPQYRAIIQRYWFNYIRRQTDRQTDEIFVPTIEHNNGQEVWSQTSSQNVSS